MESASFSSLKNDNQNYVWFNGSERNMELDMATRSVKLDKTESLGFLDLSGKKLSSKERQWTREARDKLNVLGCERCWL